MESLASGLNFPEAPVALADGAVAFSDVRAGGVHRWSPDGTVETLLDRRRGIGGMAQVAGGGLVISGRDLALLEGGETRAIFQAEGAAGFNDLGTDAAGRLYVGALHFHPFKGESPVPGAIWALGDDLPEPVEVSREIEWPNGIGFSPDGLTMYACDYAQGEVLAWDVDGGGLLSGRRVFARSPAGSADGLAVDEEGAVLVALGQGGGIARLLADGSLERIIDVPAEFVTSLCFGGEDMRDVYVTAMGNPEDQEPAGTVFRARADVPGLPVQPARV
jgi:gluconolactonase